MTYSKCDQHLHVSFHISDYRSFMSLSITKWYTNIHLLDIIHIRKSSRTSSTPLYRTETLKVHCFCNIIVFWALLSLGWISVLPVHSYPQQSSLFPSNNAWKNLPRELRVWWFYFRAGTETASSVLSSPHLNITKSHCSFSLQHARLTSSPLPRIVH